MDLIRDAVSDRIIASARKLAQQKGAARIYVRDVLNDLHLSNRVFYNRFHNMDEVLQILYDETVRRVRDSLSIPWAGEGDFMQHIMTVAERTLILSYETRRDISAYIFEADSISDTNFAWWNQEIRRLIVIGKEQKALQADLDEGATSYAIWCFIRGFNADAMARELPMEEALRLFRYGFRCFLNGIKA